MEFALEMIVKAGMHRLRITRFPTLCHGRDRARTFADIGMAGGASALPSDEPAMAFWNLGIDSLDRRPACFPWRLPDLSSQIGQVRL